MTGNVQVVIQSTDTDVQVVSPNNVVVSTSPSQVQLITQGVQGPAGPQGPAGTGAITSFTAGANISGDTAVVLIGGLLYEADPTNLSHAQAVVGVATQGGVTGATIQVATNGNIVSGGAWSVNQIYWIGLNGVLTNSPNISGAVWLKQVGIAQTSSQLLVEMQSTVIL